MNTQPIIERLSRPIGESDLRDLSSLLVATVESGAAVSFLAPLSVEDAKEWWQKAISTASEAAIFLIARVGGGIVGTVQAHPSWAPNQPHRAEVAKLMVHPRAKRKGLGTLLMQAIEAEALRSGFGLLTLDTKRGCEAEGLYRRLEWVYVGTIPSFALDPDRGALHDDVIFYKELTPEVARRHLR